MTLAMVRAAESRPSRVFGQ